MEMIINNINPDIVRIGPFSIRFYGIVYALGFLFVSHILAKKAEQGKIKNLDKEKAVDIVIIGMISGLIGARIFHVVSDFYLYKDNLIGIFEIWNGGLGFQGGFIAAVISLYIYCKKHRINLLQVLDAIALPLPLVIAFGRIANYINSENIGLISNVPWCVVFEKVDMFCRHPAQIYQAISKFLLFFTLFALSRTKFSKKTGNQAWSFIFGYGLIRFITDFFRIYPHHIFGLSHTQVFDLAMAAIGGYFLVRNNRTQSSKK